MFVLAFELSCGIQLINVDSPIVRKYLVADYTGITSD